MKKNLFICFIFLLISTTAISQIVTQPLDKPSPGKSLVYFVRSNSTGFTLNFRIYDKDKFLVALGYEQYLVYECEPGQHLFWAAAENRDFVDADLEADKVYVIDIEGQMGAFIAGVAMVPFNPQDKGNRKDLYKIVKKERKILFSDIKDEDTLDRSENIAQALEKYSKLKEKNSNKIELLSKEMFFLNADKP